MGDTGLERSQRMAQKRVQCVASYYNATLDSVECRICKLSTHYCNSVLGNESDWFKQFLI